MSRLLVTGSTGMLGREVAEAAVAARHDVTGLSTSEAEPCDLTDPAAVRRFVERARPDLIIHCAAWTAVDDCESDPGRAFAVNAEGTTNLATVADDLGVHIVHVSTDYVFDGTKDGPYVETDPTNPLSVYGRSKLAAEQVLRPDHTIVRTSWVCGLHGPNMVRTILRLAAEHPELRFVDDQIGHPTFTASLAPMLLDLGRRRAGGIWHITNQGAVSWFEFAQDVLRAAGLDPDRVKPVATADLLPLRPAPRPANSVLANAALEASGRPLLPHYREPLADLVREILATTTPS